MVLIESNLVNRILYMLIFSAELKSMYLFSLLINLLEIKGSYNFGLLSFLLSLQQCDVNLDGAIDREEFVKLMTELTKDTFSTVSQGLIISLVVAPSVALATKRATEGVPGVGKVVQKLPSSVYASLVTLIVVAAQSASLGY